MALVLCFALNSPALAEENEDGTSLMERGAQMLMEGLLREMEPAMDDLLALSRDFGPALESFVSQMGPALRDMLKEVQDWSAYHPPEILENGDIIIRRKKPPAESQQPDVPGEQIDI